VREITVDWGDGRRTASRHGRLRHRYARSGRSNVKVTVRDKARNETVRRLRG
jgi:hypothetical protein